mmetsp:Transcript_31392/g.38955  ORF Transcript_31392/g.38955 Transcript_31392/m.38955 type:complete len:145 (+) Transcript_31392:555-989(+)
MIAGSSHWLPYFESFLVVAEMFITFATIVAMHRINKRSKALEEMGIRKSYIVMKLYIGSWVANTLNSIVITGFSIAIVDLSDLEDITIKSITDDATKKQFTTFVRVNIALLVLFLLKFFYFACLDLIIMVHYWRAGDQLRSQLA